MKNTIMKGVAAAIVLAITACTSPTSDGNPGGGSTKTLDSISASPASVTLQEGGTRLITVTGHYSDSSASAVTDGVWSVPSGNQSQITVEGNTIHAVAATEGPVTLTVAKDGKTDTVSVTVTEAAVPEVPDFLFSSTAEPDVASSYDNWSSGTTIETLDTDADYDSVLSLTSGTGWGDVSAIGFNNIAPQGKLVRYTGFQFKVKSTSYTAVTVKFPGATTAEVSYSLADGTALSNGWVLIEAPFSDFGTVPVLENQVGIFKFGAGSMQLTDIGFTGENEVTTSALDLALSAAEDLYDAHGVGTGDGDVSQEAQDALDAAIDAADGAATTTWDEVEAALNALEEAVAAFTDAILHIGPSDLAPAPTLDAGDVISLYNSSGTYTDITVANWNPGWGQSSSLSDATVDGKTVKLLHLVDYQGVDFSGDIQDVTGFTKLHLSYWTANGNEFKVYAINAAGDGYSADLNAGVLTGAVTQNGWTELEITLPTSDFHTNIQQLKFDTGTGDFYLDNIYFH